MNCTPKITDIQPKTWLEEAKEHGIRKAIRRLNDEPNGIYATGISGLQYNPRGSCARIRQGKLEIYYVGAGEPEGIRLDGYLDVSNARGFIDSYGRSIYAS